HVPVGRPDHRRQEAARRKEEETHRPQDPEEPGEERGPPEAGGRETGPAPDRRAGPPGRGPRRRPQGPLPASAGVRPVRRVRKLAADRGTRVLLRPGPVGSGTEGGRVTN